MPIDPPSPPGTFDLVEHLCEVLTPHTPAGVRVVVIVVQADGSMTYGGNCPRRTIGQMALLVAERVAREPFAGHTKDIVTPERGRG
jgi:hypothetical protein